MNHLKHILGVNVPRHASSSAAPTHCGQHADLYLKSRQLRSQLLRPESLFPVRGNHDIGVKSPQIRQAGMHVISKGSKTICKQRSKTKSSIVSLKKTSIDKKLSLQCIKKIVRHYSTYQNSKFNSDGTSKQNIPQSIEVINCVKCMKNRNSSFVASIENHSRSYAEMIADYSESMYKASTVGTLNDGLNFKIRKSPFSTLSSPLLDKKIVNITEHGEGSIQSRQNNPSLSIDHTNIIETSNKNGNHYRSTMKDLKKEDQSYAKLVGDCSKYTYGISLADTSNSSLVPKRNIEDPLTFATSTKNANSANTQKTLKKTIPTTAAMPINKNVKEQAVDWKEDNWLKEVKNAIGDLKSITERKTTRTVNIPIMKENDDLKSTDESGIHMHKQEETDITIGRLVHQYNNMDKTGRYKKDLSLHKNNYSQLSDKTQHFNSAKTISNLSTNNSMQLSSNNNANTLKRPQVELRMVPTEKESVVSINVDSVSTELLHSLNNHSKELSVIVQSDQKKDQRSTDVEWNTSTPHPSTKSASQHTNFGPMRISISEDSAPVKQIEFSINGKPVSELKSITARAEKLDVVSSMDKIEIRIPFTKDSTNTTNKIREDDLSKGADLSKGKILNVQISANFQTQSTKGITESTYKMGNTVPVSSSVQVPKIHYVLDDSAKVGEGKSDTFDKDNMQQAKSLSPTGKSGNIIQKSINQQKTLHDSNIKIQNKTMKELLIDKFLTDLSSTEKVRNSKIGRLDLNKLMKHKIVRSPEINNNEKSEFTDHRIPSKIIPWWSSSDCFNNIKKKKDYHKSVTPPTNLIEKKAMKLTQHRLNESLSPQEMLNSSKTLKKETQSINKTSINNSNNISSTLWRSSNFLEKHEEVKPTVHYSNVFRRKPNREDSSTIPGITKIELKKETDHQTLIAKSSNEKNSKIEQSNRAKISEIKNTQNINIKFDTCVEKTSNLQRSLNVPSSAQDLQSKRNLENKQNHLLKQTKSVNDLFNTKPKTENTLNAIKPIEKKEDGTLIDYGLKVSSRKSTIKLNNNEIKMIQNVLSAKTKDLTSKKSTIEEISKSEQTDKRISDKQIGFSNLLSQMETNKVKKWETKTNILKENGKIIKIVKKPTDVTTQEKNNVKNTKEGNKSDMTVPNTSNLKNSSESILMTEKHKELPSDTIVSQRNVRKYVKSAMEFNKDRLNSPSSIKTSPKTMQNIKSDKLEESAKISSKDLNKDRSKSLSRIKNSSEITGIQKSKELSSSKSKKNNQQPSKESVDKKTMDQTKLQLKTTNEVQRKIVITNKSSISQTKSEAISKTNNHTVSKTPIIITLNPPNKSSPKNGGQNNSNNPKSEQDRKSPSGSASFPTKTDDSANLKSSGSEIRIKSRIMANDKRTYTGKSLFIDYANLDRNNGSLMKSRSPIFKTSRNLNNVDGVLNDHRSGVIENTRQWSGIDRPEKNMLYSIWLQRFRNDINNNEKLF